MRIRGEYIPNVVQNKYMLRHCKYSTQSNILSIYFKHNSGESVKKMYKEQTYIILKSVEPLATMKFNFNQNEISIDKCLGNII